MRLLPREDRHPDETGWGGEFGRRRGTPYVLHRGWLGSLSGLLQRSAMRRAGCF